MGKVTKGVIERNDVTEIKKNGNKEDLQNQFDGKHLI